MTDSSQQLAEAAAAQADATAQREIRQVARSGGVSLAGAMCAALLGFGLVVLVSRGLGPSGAGTFSLIVAVFMTISVAGRLGADTALVRLLPRLRVLDRPAEIRAAIQAALVPVCIAMTVLAALLWWLAPVVAAVLLGPAANAESAHLLRLIAVLLPLGTGSYVALAATRGLGSVVPLVVVENIVKPAMRCVLVALVLLAGAGVFGVTLAWAIATVVGVGLSAYALRVAVKRLDGMRPTHSRRTWAELWSFALPRAGAQLCEIAGLHAGVVLAGMIGSTADAGVYNAVLRLVLAGTLGMQALRIAIAPQLSRLITAGDHGAAQTIHQTSTAWVVLLSWPPYLLMAIWPEHVLALFGSGFDAGSVALTVLSVAMLANLGTGNVGTVLLMSGRSGANVAVSVISLTIQIGAALLLAPIVGVFAVVVAKAAAIIVENAAMEYLVRASEQITTFGRPVWAAGALAILCFAIPGLLVRFVGVPSHGGLGLAIASGAALASATVYIVAIIKLRHIYLACLHADTIMQVVHRLRGRRTSVH